MKASALTQEAMRANHAAHAQQNRVAGLLASEPTTANREAVEQLTVPRLHHYRGRYYLIRPVPHLVGLEHRLILEQLDRGAAGAAIDEQALVASCLRLFRRYIRPVAPWGALPWWLRQNPFRAATVRELGELNASFLVARTM